MILEHTRTHLSERRKQRKERAAVWQQADMAAEVMLYAPDPSYVFDIGQAPSTMSIKDFTEAVGAAALKRMRETTPMEIARYDSAQTVLGNLMRPGLDIESFEQVPPPQTSAIIVFDKYEPPTI